jgi:hypothetical protein
MNINSNINKLENVYNEQGAISIGTDSHMMKDNLHVRNFATINQITCADIYADGACFFQYAPGLIQYSTNAKTALKIMQTNNVLSTVNVEYLDLRNLAANEIGYVIGHAAEVLFHSPEAIKNSASFGPNRQFFGYDISYANDPNDSDITKFIGTTADGFASREASLRNNNIYGVLNLQDWTGATPPNNKTASQLDCWTAIDFNTALAMLELDPAHTQRCLIPVFACSLTFNVFSAKNEKLFYYLPVLPAGRQVAGRADSPRGYSFAISSGDSPVDLVIISVETPNDFKL